MLIVTVGIISKSRFLRFGFGCVASVCVWTCTPLLAREASILQRLYIVRNKCYGSVF